jgi:hypothetical protein
MNGRSIWRRSRLEGAFRFSEVRVARANREATTQCLEAMGLDLLGRLALVRKVL